ncbi:hypothetical protein Q5P01_011786 [Channa striata]|uniref:Uncharacterized protein n=1 Tax=Channa striata TaxID=64152 RepID=A0AA88SR44_CHASR|nr:hypothetical protein Q5P01_011786 [Channa striata]
MDWRETLPRQNADGRVKLAKEGEEKEGGTRPPLAHGRHLAPVARAEPDDNPISHHVFGFSCRPASEKTMGLCIAFTLLVDGSRFTATSRPDCVVAGKREVSSERQRIMDPVPAHAARLHNQPLCWEGDLPRAQRDSGRFKSFYSEALWRFIQQGVITPKRGTGTHWLPDDLSCAAGRRHEKDNFHFKLSHIGCARSGL